VTAVGHASTDATSP